MEEWRDEADAGAIMRARASPALRSTSHHSTTPILHHSVPQMIGDEYFELRSRLGTELFALGGLIREFGGDAEALAVIDNLIHGLRDPFVFVVVGEVNVGKSTFLNALFGQDFSRTGVMPTTDKICFFKYGPVVQQKAVTPTLDEVQAPCDFLRDFHIVDTPGTNSIESEHQAITERFVPNADLVIFVFSAMNPWGASAWQFLDRVHRHWMRNVIFVLQQCDLRSPEEIQVITDYMAQLSRQRFGREFPLFPVSAKKAFMARSSGIDRDQLLADSGFLGLEQHISQTVTRTASRIAKLGSAHRIGRQLLDQLAARIGGQLDSAKAKRSLIHELQTERALQAGRTLKKLAPALEATEMDCREASAKIVAMSRETLSLKTATKPESEDDRGPGSLDHRLFQEIMFRVGERWRQIAAVVEEDHRQFSRYLHSQSRDALYLAPLNELRDIEEPAADTRRRFVAKIESTLRKFVIGLRLDEAVEPALAVARRRSNLLPLVLAIGVVAAGVAFWFAGGDWRPPVIAAAAGVLCWMLAWFYVGSPLSRTRSLLKERLADSGIKLREMLAAVISEDTEQTFSRFLGILTPAGEEADNREQSLCQQSERISRLRESLDEMERQLQRAAPASK